MAEQIYPGGIRINNFSMMYCEMAMESYYKAIVSHKNMVESNYSWDCCEELDTLKKAVISTVVFSSMTIEAFINDYAAACLGDSDFYDSFDKLPLLGKLELIAGFIFKEKMDKSKAYYSRINALSKRRNLAVHSKSKRAQFQGYILEEMQEIEKIYNSGEFEIEEPLLDVAEIKSTMRDGLNALKAIRDMAIYFDEHDSNIYAVKKLFPSPEAILIPANSGEYRLPILRLLEIKVDKP